MKHDMFALLKIKRFTTWKIRVARGPICLPGRQVRLLRKVRLLQNLTDEDLQKHHIDVAT